jgi:hypothetical protein
MGTTECVLAALILSAWFTLIIFLTPTALLPDTSLSNPSVPSPKCEGRCCRLIATAKNLGANFMSVLDDALARFTSFVTGVVAQLKAAGETNGTQTGKLAELQSALDAALADDSADKATIAALQAEVNTLQDSVAAQINAAIDSLQNPPADVVSPDPVVEDVPVAVEDVPVVVEDVSVVEDTPATVDETGETPVG